VKRLLEGYDIGRGAYLREVFDGPSHAQQLFLARSAQDWREYLRRDFAVMQREFLALGSTSSAESSRFAALKALLVTAFFPLGRELWRPAEDGAAVCRAREELPVDVFYSTKRAATKPRRPIVPRYSPSSCETAIVDLLQIRRQRMGQ